MPVTIGLIAAGTQAAGGLYQSLSSGRGKAERDFERMASSSPQYMGNPSIDRYYQEALSRYGQNPYQSAQYQASQNAAQRATATGISGLQSRGAAIGGIGRLASIQDAAMQNAGVQAEAERNRRFGQLGGATQMKTAEDYRKFDINQLTPYNRMLQVKQMKAQAANERFNAGLNMIGGAASNAAMAGMMAKPKAPVDTLAATSARVPESTVSIREPQTYAVPSAPTHLFSSSGVLSGVDQTTNFLQRQGRPMNPNYIPSRTGYANATGGWNLTNWTSAPQ